jgi:hypothetical protein
MIDRRHSYALGSCAVRHARNVVCFLTQLLCVPRPQSSPPPSLALPRSTALFPRLRSSWPDRGRWAAGTPVAPSVRAQTSHSFVNRNTSRNPSAPRPAAHPRGPGRPPPPPRTGTSLLHPHPVGAQESVHRAIAPVAVRSALRGHHIARIRPLHHEPGALDRRAVLIERLDEEEGAS